MIRQFIDLFGALVVVIGPIAVFCFYLEVPLAITSLLCSALAAVISVALAGSGE